MRRPHPAAGARIVAAGLSVAAAAGIVAATALTDQTPAHPPPAHAPAAGAPPSESGTESGTPEPARPGSRGGRHVTSTGPS